MAVDLYQGFENILSSSERWAVVVPSDAADLPTVPKALYFSAGGDVVLVGDDGVTVTFTVVAQQTLDVRPMRVKATGTTVPAGKIVALN